MKTVIRYEVDDVVSINKPIQGHNVGDEFKIRSIDLVQSPDPLTPVDIVYALRQLHGDNVIYVIQENILPIVSEDVVKLELTKVERHKVICDLLNDIYERKNNDYGDSFAQLRARVPSAILVRLFDKYSRLESLMNGTTQKVSDESIDDTLMDLANYCIMELVERSK